MIPCARRISRQPGSESSAIRYGMGWFGSISSDVGAGASPNRPASAGASAGRKRAVTFLMKGDEGMKSLGVDRQQESEDVWPRSWVQSGCIWRTTQDIGHALRQQAQNYRDLLSNRVYEVVKSNSSSLVNDGLIVATNGDIPCNAPLTLAHRCACDFRWDVWQKSALPRHAPEESPDQGSCVCRRETTAGID